MLDFLKVKCMLPKGHWTRKQPQRQCCRSNAWLCYIRGSRISLFPQWWGPKAKSDIYLLRGGLSRPLSWCNLMMMSKDRGQPHGTQVWEAGGWGPRVSSWPRNHQEGGKPEIYKSVKQALNQTQPAYMDNMGPHNLEHMRMSTWRLRHSLPTSLHLLDGWSCKLRPDNTKLPPESMFHIELSVEKALKEPQSKSFFPGTFIFKFLAHSDSTRLIELRFWYAEFGPWKKSCVQPRQHIKKQRHYFADK